MSLHSELLCFRLLAFLLNMLTYFASSSKWTLVYKHCITVRFKKILLIYLLWWPLVHKLVLYFTITIFTSICLPHLHPPVHQSHVSPNLVLQSCFWPCYLNFLLLDPQVLVLMSCLLPSLLCDQFILVPTNLSGDNKLLFYLYII